MENLYRELAAGADPAVALRRAKLTLLGSGTAYRKPYYWGPFVTFTARG
jgi:CHAT domain-containing protein